MNKYKVMAVLLCAIFLFGNRAEADMLRDAVVKIFVTTNRVDYYRPWQSTGSRSRTGSGVIISGNRILTNAHVVNDSTFIQVRKESSPKKFTAKVEKIANDCDLAVLSVGDPEFFKNITPLDFGQLPNLQDKVTVIGFPLGGDKLSITEGVVSRIEIVPYTQSGKNLLGVQIDAAINPGNSGGPVLQDGKIAGIAMQIISNSQNIGYMIPTPIIDHFLSDLKDEKYDGFPTLGVNFNHTENRTLREFYKIKGEGGVLISNVVPYSAADGILKRNDVLLEVDDIPIGEDGTFEFRKNERLLFSHLINRKQVHEHIRLKIIRNGKEFMKEVKLTKFKGLVAAPNFYDKPPYYVYGGLVFSVLSIDLLKAYGDKWWRDAPLDFLYYVIGKGNLNDERARDKVVLLEVLPDDINIGYHGARNEVIDQVNGVKFKSFQELVELLNKKKSHDVVIFKTDHSEQIFLSGKDIEATSIEIIERNNIPAQYSEDVEAWIK